MLRSDEALAALRAAPRGARVARRARASTRARGSSAARCATRCWAGRVAGAELDVVVEGDPEPVARALGEVVAWHERFGTYDVVDAGRRPRRRRDGARRALRRAGRAAGRPRRRGLEDDLLRRDFTVNALALDARGRAGTPRPRRWRTWRPGGCAIMHAASFRDDPTRLWRLVRYAVRLGFAPEPATDRLAYEAVAARRAGRPSAATASAPSCGWRCASRTRSARCTPRRTSGCVDGLTLDPALVARALALLPAGEGRADLTLLGAVIPDAAWVDGWGFTAARAARVLTRCALRAAAARRARGRRRSSPRCAASRSRPSRSPARAATPTQRAAVPGRLAPRPAADRRQRPARRRASPQGPELGRRLDAVARRAPRRRAAPTTATRSSPPRSTAEPATARTTRRWRSSCELPGARVRFTGRAGGVSRRRRTRR